MHRHLALLAVVLAPVGSHLSPPTASADPTPRSASAVPAPDVVGFARGGTAARLLIEDGTPVPGDVFVLMGLPGLERPARVWDETPYPYSRPDEHPDSQQSNVDARSLVEELVGELIDAERFTTPSGGGSSVGLAYTLGYLNVWSGGGFTGEVSSAATGRLETFGWIFPVTALEEKLAAAVAAGVDVVFTPTWPAASSVDDFRVRRVGTVSSQRFPGTVVADARAWDDYRRWGADRRDGRVDLVGVRHVGDVAAYLCGAGSVVACELLEAISVHVAQDPALRPIAGIQPDRTPRSEVRPSDVA